MTRVYTYFMNEQFRVAQKIGLMFRLETKVPEDIKNWALTQLHADSPALGIATKYGNCLLYTSDAADE